MGEGTRKVHVGAQATAPTAPHATPAVEPGDARTGPARFWRTRRLRVAIAAALSVIGHFAVGPFSFFPSGPSLEITDQDGDLTIHDLRSYEVAQRMSLAESGAVEIPSVIFGGEEGHQVFACSENCAFKSPKRTSELLYSGPAFRRRRPTRRW